MTTVAAGSSSTYTFTGSQSVSVTLDPGETALVEIRRGGVIISSQQVTGSRTLGPYISGDVMSLTAIRGTVDYSVSDATSAATVAAPSNPTAWFKFDEGTGTTVSEYFTTISATVGGTTTGIWGSAPGVTFNGTDNQIPFTATSGLLRQIMGLSTLTAGVEQLVIWMLISHPAPITAGALFWWGLSSETTMGGWGLHSLVSNKLLQWRQRGVGSSAVQQVAVNSTLRAAGFEGSTTTNTRSALALEIMRSAAYPGYLEITGYKKNVAVAGALTQNDCFCQSIIEAHDSSTALPNYNTSGALTFGAQPTTNQSTFNSRLPSGWALANVGFQRRKTASRGIGGRIVRDIYTNSTAGSHYLFPASALGA